MRGAEDQDLDAITALLHRRRAEHGDTEIWEAADLQWWWARRGFAVRIWDDAAVVLTRWSSTFAGCEVLADADHGAAWAEATQACPRMDVERVEMAVAEGDVAVEERARGAGFRPSDQSHGVSWLDPQARVAPRRPLPPGYRIRSRAEDSARPHPMTARNGEQIEQRLRRCSLYDAALDLSVLAPDGAVAGYALFWADPVTGIGMTEPMRVEEGHAGLGLAAQLLDAGLRALTVRGSSRLKVSFQPRNPAPTRLYAAAGFRVQRYDRTWVHAADQERRSAAG